MLKTLCKLTSLVLMPIKQNGDFVVLMYLLGSFCILFEPLAWFGSRLLSLFELFLDIYLLCCLFCMVSGKVRNLLKGISYFIFYMTAIVDMGCYVRFGTGITPNYVQMAVQSNWHETSEMFSSYFTISELLDFRMLVVALFPLIHIFISYRKGRFSTMRFKYQRLLGGTVIALLLTASFIAAENKKYMYYRVIRQMSELEFQEHEDMTPATGYYVPIYRLCYSLSEYSNLRPVSGVLYRTLSKSVADSCSFYSPNIVVIIGESYNKSHSHLYGYRLPTTPFQDSLATTGRLVAFTDVISSWNTTCESMENILSLYTVGDKGKWYEYPFFTTMLKKSGYTTFFLSNQFVTNPGGSFSAFIEDIFINDSIVSKSQFNYRNQSTHAYDGNLIEDYKNLSRYAGEHNLWIFHTMGLHAKFSERYPDSWHRFSTKDYDRPDLTEKNLEELVDYDNALYYNDYVISEIIKCFDEKNAVIIFFPDHGERVFDNSQEFGRNLTWNKNDIYQQFQIPFWFYFTKSYIQNHPDVLNIAKGVSNQRYMTDKIAHTILSLAGIKSSYYKPEYDILNKKYCQKRKRIIREKRNFDNL